MSQILHTLHSGIRRLGLNEYTTNSVIPDAAYAWADRVVTNGGLYPSSSTIYALGVFYQGLVDNNLLSKMKAINCFVPDNLVAAITPLVKTYGNDPWTNHNFAISDLTVNGLKGDGSTRYLETGVNPLICFASTGVGGQTIYVPSDNGNYGTGNMSAYDNSTTCFALYLSGGDNNTYWDCYSQNVGSGRISVSSPSFLGYTSGNRGVLDGTVTTAIYKGSSAIGHITATSGAYASNGNLPNRPLPAFGQNSNGSYGQFDPRRWSFAAIHDGLLVAESAIFYDLIQTMRISLGGGYA